VRRVATRCQSCPGFEEEPMQPTFQIGQLVRLQSPHGQGESRTYCVTRILPARDERTSAYLIKTMTGAERLVKPHDIKAASANAVP
jgi:hypothetical protein